MDFEKDYAECFKSLATSADTTRLINTFSPERTSVVKVMIVQALTQIGLYLPYASGFPLPYPSPLVLGLCSSLYKTFSLTILKFDFDHIR